MKTVKRAIYYIIRKKGKSLLLFIIIFIIASFVLSGISVNRASIAAQKDLRQSLGGSFNIGLRYSKENPYYHEDISTNEDGENVIILYCSKQISKNMVKEISNIEGVLNCNATETDICRIKDINIFPGNIPVDKEFKNHQTMIGTYSTQNNIDFLNGSVNLIEGRHIEPDDNQVVIMSKDLADKNNLSINDMISVLDRNGTEVKIKIIGIFQQRETESIENKVTSYDKIQNRIYTDLNTRIKVENSNYVTGYKEITATASDPQNMQRLIEEIKRVKGYDDKAYEVFINNDAFRAAEGGLRKVETMTNIFLYGSLAISIVILSLILTMWNRNRIHETGVYLALGLKKKKIICQYLIEVLLIGYISCGFAFFSGQIISNSLVNYVLETDYEQIEEKEKQQGRSVSVEDRSETNDLAVGTNELIIRIGFNEMLQLYGVGTLIICISIGISSIYVILLKPREILAKMS